LEWFDYIIQVTLQSLLAIKSKHFLFHFMHAIFTNKRVIHQVNNLTPILAEVSCVYF
jgi:hypothetical protein